MVLASAAMKAGPRGLDLRRLPPNRSRSAEIAPGRTRRLWIYHMPGQPSPAPDVGTVETFPAIIPFGTGYGSDIKYTFKVKLQTHHARSESFNGCGPQRGRPDNSPEFSQKKKTQHPYGLWNR